MRAFPAATCTVMVLVPSARNVKEMLLSKVMRGCKKENSKIPSDFHEVAGFLPFL